MRYLLALLLVAGLGYLGYQYATGTGWQFGKEPNAANGESGLLVFNGAVVQASGLPAGSVAKPRDQVLAERFREALLRGDFRGLETDPGGRASLPRGTSGRYALEVALALERPDAADQEVEHAAKALVDAKLEEGVRLTAAGFTLLATKQRPAAAISAVGGSNHFLAGKESRRGLDSFSSAVGRHDLVDQAHLLTKCLETLTSGRAFWDDYEPTAERVYYRQTVERVYRELNRVNGRLVFGSGGSWQSRHHKVKPGQTLDRIAQRFERELGIAIAPGFLQMINGIRRAEGLRVGAVLRIPTAKMRVVIEKGTHTMKVYLGDVMVRLYQVGLGKDGCTPAATFEVEEKHEKPSWTHPKTGEFFPYGHPGNVLGEYFVKLAHPQFHGYGIHGTDQQETVGRDASMGCIRMRKQDMEALFAFLPRRAKVEVRND